MLWGKFRINQTVVATSKRVLENIWYRGYGTKRQKDGYVADNHFHSPKPPLRLGGLTNIYVLKRF